MGRRLQSSAAKPWLFGRRARKAASFERVHLPDGGETFLKPPLGMFTQEMEDSQDLRHVEAVACFEAAEGQVKTWRYRDAVTSYRASYEACEGLSALLAWGVALTMVSALREASEVFEEGGDLALRQRAAQFEAAFKINLGQVCNDLGEPDRAREVLEGAQNLCREAEDCAMEVLALRHLGMVLLAQASYVDALACCDRAIQVSTRMKDERGVGYALCNKGIILMAKGDLRTAEEIFQRGLALPSKDPFVQGRLYTNLATLHLTWGKLQEATSATERALEVHRSIAYPHGEARNLGALAALQMTQGNVEEGHRTFDRAIEMDRLLEYRRGEARTFLALARAHLQSGRIAEARRFFQAAHDIAGGASCGHFVAEASAMLALLTTDAQPEARIRRLEGALELSRSVRSPVLETQIVSQFGLLHASDGRLDEAMICCQQSVERSREIGNLLEEARSLINLAHVQCQRGEKDLAAENVGVAQALFLNQGFEVNGSDGP